MKGGCLELIIEKGKEKPSGGYYWDKNSIKDYIKRKDDNTKSQNGYDQLDDEIPFQELFKMMRMQQSNNEIMEKILQTLDELLNKLDLLVYKKEIKKDNTENIEDMEF